MDIRDALADLTSQRIEGITRLGHPGGGEGGIPFNMPLVSEILPRLWMGGHPRTGVPSFFNAVLNLYPWGDPYSIDLDQTEIRVHKMHDSLIAPDEEEIEDLVSWVDERWMGGKTVLVHCQAGLNRSGLIMGCLLVNAGIKPDAAVALLRAKRSPAVLCNPKFEEIVTTWSGH